MEEEIKNVGPVQREQPASEMDELDTLRNKFIQVVSHQLRTPLNTIRWNLKALLSGDIGELKKEQHEFVRVSYEANLDIIKRIHEMITALEIQEGRISLREDSVSIESLLNSVLREWKNIIAAKGIELSYVKPERPILPVMVDMTKMREVFSTLVENAYTYTLENGKIAVRLQEKGERVRLEVEDTGVGIPEAEQLHIFTRFYRASNAPAMKPDSSGLALAIAKYFAEQHGGTIGFTSKEGKGSTFWVEIPE